MVHGIRDILTGRTTASRVARDDASKHKLDNTGILTDDAIVTYTRTCTAVNDCDFLCDGLPIKRTTEHEPKVVLGNQLELYNAYPGLDEMDRSQISDMLRYFTSIYLFEGKEEMQIYMIYDKRNKVFADIYALEIVTTHEYRKSTILGLLQDF